eukprot:s3411_g3.t1
MKSVHLAYTERKTVFYSSPCQFASVRLIAMAAVAPQHICYLCTRKFTDAAALKTHEQYSQLHQQNLDRQDGVIRQHKEEVISSVNRLRQQLHDAVSSSNPVTSSRAGAIETQLRQQIGEFSQAQEAIEYRRAGSDPAKQIRHAQAGTFRPTRHEMRCGRLHFEVPSGEGVNMYNWPVSADQAAVKLVQLQKVVMEKDAALKGFSDFMRSEAQDLLTPPSHNPQGNSKMEEWRLFCIKEKAIYNILNLCSGEIALRVNVWYPASEESKIIALLQKLNEGSQQGAFLTNEKQVKSVAPTYIRVNDFTEGWQEVIDTYGIPKYQEANPALLSVVTFPFIFGMMYGDVGHGTLLFLAGLWLCKNAESLRFTQPTLFMVRYMVVSLGFFAIYAGFMYNDFFSVGLQLFDSRWKDVGEGNYEPDYDVKNSGGRGPYPFGLDWAWHGSNNELLYVNSLKMKLSVLFGVLQMTVGVFLRWGNAFYEKNMTDFFCECVPMMIFMLCFFGWMDVMILYKWVHPIDNPPSIINSLICMAMGQKDLFPLWDGSVELAQTLMMYTVCAVPIMLLPKPLILLYQHNQSKKAGEGAFVAIEEHASNNHGHLVLFGQQAFLKHSLKS